MKTETIYTIVIAVLCAVAGFSFAPGRELALMDIVLVKLVSVSVFFSFTVSLLFVLRGTRYDVLQTVFDDNNLAGGVFTGLLLVALALVLGK